ncbi:MAG: MerR family DNA-binding transcriptional regulator [Oscillospiraceae bacterium]|nr:MerR family DNA-binding transcriptional regulator [Oscillospiraceae bacterium]
MKKAISAIELADFMGISLRALRKLDESGELRAFRRENGRRYYTGDHIQTALKIMGGADVKEVEVSFCKNGISSMYGKLCVPARLLAKLGITPESPGCYMSCDGEKIIFTKERPE